VESLKKELKSCKEKLCGAESLKDETKVCQERSQGLISLIHDLTSNQTLIDTPMISKLQSLLEDLTRHNNNNNKGTIKRQNK
jgi:hypothetical protein